MSLLVWWLVTGEVALGVVGTVAFLAAFGRPWRSPDPQISWHITFFSAATGTELLSLLLLALGVPVPLFVLALVFAAVDAAIGWRLWLLLSARRKAPAD